MSIGHGEDGREFFQFLAFRWDVTRAQQIARTLPTRRIDPRPWFALLGVISVDEDHLAHADLERPLILASIREFDGAVLIIDGWHRLARAQRDAVTDVPAVLLDQDQEFEVRVFGGDKPQHAQSPPHPLRRRSALSRCHRPGPYGGQHDRKA